MLADALRMRILTRELRPGQKLPIEPELADEYAVSRSTVREALRVLASQGLVTTSRGVLGGSFVAYPSPRQMSDYLEASLGLFAQSDELAVEALLEARDMLEVPAAGLAAVRRSADDLEILRGTLGDPPGPEPRQIMEFARTFHEKLLRIADNPIVEALTRPVFEVLYERMVRFTAPEPTWSRVKGDHQLIFDAVAEGDAEAARAEMRIHLQKLRPACR
jgi:GntR family transcriptional regulator, transcriptional repressor for pyruvate dehydrogenase complex